jgi:hypothetical protein
MKETIVFLLAFYSLSRDGNVIFKLLIQPNLWKCSDSWNYRAEKSHEGGSLQPSGSAQLYTASRGDTSWPDSTPKVPLLLRYFEL